MPARDAATGRFISSGSGGGFDLGSAYAKVLIDESGVDSGISSIQDKFKSLGRSLTDIGSSMTMLGAPFLAFGALAVKSFSDSQNSLAQLDAVLRSTGGAAGVTRDQAIELSKAFEQETKFSDEATLGAESMLLTFTNIGKNVFPLTTQTALDMSQALGQDLKSSSIQLGKALNDPIKGITALTRVGVTFTQAQKDMIKTMVEAGKTEDAQRVILNELQKEFGGSAVAAGETFSGQLVILQNKFDDLMETIGEKLIPIIDTFTGYISGLIDWFKNLDPSIQNIIIGIGAFMASLALLGPVIAAIGVGISAIGTLLGALFSPIGLVIAAIAGLVLAFQNNFLGLRDFLQPIIDSIGDFFAHFSDRVKLYTSLALLYFEYYITNPLSDFWNQKLKPAFDAFVAWFQVDGLPAIQNALNDFKVNVWDKIVSAIGTIWDAVKGAFKLFSDWFTSSGTSGGLSAITVAINLFIAQVIDPFIKHIQDIWTKIQPQLEVLKLGMQAVFGWINTNVIQPIVNAIQSIIDKVNLAVQALAAIGGGQAQFVPGATFTPGVGGVGASGGQIAIPSQSGGGGSVGVGAQGISSGNTINHYGDININANTRAQGQQAMAGALDEIESRYRGRGN